MNKLDDVDGVGQIYYGEKAKKIRMRAWSWELDINKQVSI